MVHCIWWITGPENAKKLAMNSGKQQFVFPSIYMFLRQTNICLHSKAWWHYKPSTLFSIAEIHVCIFLPTKICSVVETGALESCLSKDKCQVTDWSIVKALSFFYKKNIIKNLKEFRTWLVDRTYYSPTTLSQGLQVWDHL